MNNSFEQKEVKTKKVTKTPNGLNLTFNVLTFKHPKEEYTFWFTSQEKKTFAGYITHLFPMK